MGVVGVGKLGSWELWTCVVVRVDLWSCGLVDLWVCGVVALWVSGAGELGSCGHTLGGVDAM